MTRRSWVETAALGCLAILLLVVGAALRPLVAADDRPAPPVLTDTEIGFAQDMLAHHSQALLMVQRLDSGVDPTVHALAQQISDTQRTEIGMLLGWLRMARALAINPQPMAWMHTDRSETADHHHTGPATSTAATTSAAMPGMATQAELAALAAARGADAESLFLQLMRRHHLGGIQMAQAAERQLSSGIVKQAARDMLDTQSREIGVLGLLLSRS